MARPEVVKTDLARRLRTVRESTGAPSREEFAQLLGFSVKTLANYERGDTQPDALTLAAYRQVVGVDTNWLITGVGEPFRTQANSQEAQSSGLDSNLDQPNFVRLPVYSEVSASAGPGIVPASERANNVVAFDRAFLRDQGGNPERCSIIFARGTSMKPTIPDGAILIVDHSQRDIDNGCIYVFSVCDHLLVKRARWRMDGRLELVSDNKNEDYPIETFGPEAIDDLRVVGRVVYFCRAP